MFLKTFKQQPSARVMNQTEPNRWQFDTYIYIYIFFFLVYQPVNLFLFVFYRIGGWDPRSGSIIASLKLIFGSIIIPKEQWEVAPHPLGLASSLSHRYWLLTHPTSSSTNYGFPLSGLLLQIIINQTNIYFLFIISNLISLLYIF